MINETKVFIENSHHSFRANIWMIEYNSNTSYNLVFENGELIRQEIKEAEPFSGNGRYPMLSLPIPIAEMFFQSIQEHLEHRGLKTKDQNRIEGELVAKQEHLDDMRMIIKKVMKIE